MSSRDIERPARDGGQPAGARGDRVAAAGDADPDAAEGGKAAGGGARRAAAGERAPARPECERDRHAGHGDEVVVNRQHRYGWRHGDVVDDVRGLLDERQLRGDRGDDQVDVALSHGDRPRGAGPAGAVVGGHPDGQCVGPPGRGRGRRDGEREGAGGTPEA